MIVKTHKRLCAVAIATALALPLALSAQQTNPPSTTPPPAAAPPPGTVPVTSQTPAGPGVDPTAPTAEKGKTPHKKHKAKSTVPAPQQPAPQ